MIDEYLRLDHRAGGVGDVKPLELEPPLGDAAYGFSVVDDVPEPAGGYDHHRVAIEVVPKLVRGDEHGVEKLLNFQIVGLRVGEDLADEVHQPLDLEGVTLLLPFHHQSHTEGAWCGSDMQEQSLPLRRGG